VASTKEPKEKKPESDDNSHESANHKSKDNSKKLTNSRKGTRPLEESKDEDMVAERDTKEMASHGIKNLEEEKLNRSSLNKEELMKLSG